MGQSDEFLRWYKPKWAKGNIYSDAKNVFEILCATNSSLVAHEEVIDKGNNGLTQINLHIIIIIFYLLAAAGSTIQFLELLVPYPSRYLPVTIIGGFVNIR
jgi:hypothetical protein